MAEPAGWNFGSRLFFSVVFLSFLSIVSLQELHSQRGYLILAPAVFRSGVDQTITVRIFDESEPVLVRASIVDWREQSIIASQTSSVQGDGKITLQVPKGVEGKATLQVCGNCHEHGKFRFQNSTTITIVNKGTSAFVQTDKTIYKPSQTVHINVYTVDRDLRPVSDNISNFVPTYLASMENLKLLQNHINVASSKVTIYAKAPNGVKIIEWKNLRPACTGTVTVSFPLSDQPPLGEWKIFAELQDNSYNTTFEVDKYVLPKFDVDIIPPLNFRDFSKCQQAIVTAHYTFGKPVQGTLEVNMTVTGLGYFARDLDSGVATRRTMPFNGEARFSICIQENLGRAELKRYFRGNLGIWATVTSGDGSKFSAFDDTAIVSRTLVDLEFTSDTRKYFKHRMPFHGEIFASYVNGSAARNVEVELTVEDIGGVFMTQEILSSSEGIASFTIPALSQSTEYLWLKARVIKIDGTLAEPRQYLAVYHYLNSWHSPSQCHLLIDKPNDKLTVDHPATLSVTSTCDCDFTLHYLIISRGDILVSNSFQVESNNSNYHDARRRRSFGNSIVPNRDNGGTQTCQTTINITPTANMAPLAKLLAYYVRPNGEGVADSIHLPIEPILENSVSIDVAKRALTPGENISLTVRADEESCVCLGATDKSLHFISPGYHLSKEEIFDEIYSYDMDNLPFEEEERRRPTTLSRSRRWRRSLHGRHLISRDSFHAFLECGLVVMTDVVALKHEQDIQVYSEFRKRQSFSQSPVQLKARKPRKLRSFFPETWYWQCFNVDSGGEHQITLEVPDSVTSWVVNAVGTSPSSGIGVAENIELIAFKAFFVDFNMPYSAIRGEEMDLSITAHNYLDSCAQVSLAVITPPEVTLPGASSENERTLVKYLCIDSGASVATKFRILFSGLGTSKVVAVADAFGGPNLCCSAEGRLISKAKEVDDTAEILRGTPIGKDALIKSILVEPEGEPREYTHSVFFCPNERMNITTPPSTFHFVKFSKKKNHFNFLTRASSSVHVALTAHQEKSDSSYEIILGGEENTISWIQKNEEILATDTTRGILSNTEFRSFWVHWTENNITIGYGMEGSAVSELLRLEIPESIDAQYVGLATSSQTAAEFRLWSTEELGDGFREVFQLEVPNYVIPGSVRGKASILGDVMGPTLRNLNNLLKLPYGCGEQNMINFAPNIHVLKYLKTTNQLSSEIEREAREYLVQGYQRQLTYRRQSGSYSAFGDRDEFGSMWLTAFVMMSYAQAKEFVYIDPAEIDRPMKWILNHQMKDGSFPAYGKILNKDVQDGINRKISLTAYVVITLLETGAVDQDRDDAVEKAVTFLEEMLYGYQDPYTAALTAYALTLANSDFAREARMILSDMAIVTGSGSYRHWSLKGHVESGLFNPNDLFAILSSNTKQTVASAEIELASYALLAFTKSEDISASLPVVRWISQQRNSLGGFSSTQDTCAALHALSGYATMAYIGGVNMNITLEGPSNYEWNVVLNDSNSEILQSSEIPALSSTPIPVFVKASGDGCALLQINVQFNIPEPEDKNEFEFHVSVAKDIRNFRPSQKRSILKRDSGEVAIPVLIEPEPMQPYSQNDPTNFGDSSTSYVRVCGRWRKDGSSNMAVLEVPLLTGFTADEESLAKTMSNRTGSLKRYEVKDSKIIFYFDEISSLCKTCVTFKMIRESVITNLSPRIARIYDYYEPGYESSVAYNTRGQIEVGHFHIEPIEAEGEYPECKCYRECGYDGPTVCGDDGNVYPNLCRMQMNSCEMERDILQQDDSLCQQDEDEATLEPPLMVPNEEFYTGLFENPSDFANFFEGNY